MVYSVLRHLVGEAYDVRFSMPNGKAYADTFFLEVYYRGDAQRASRMFAYKMLRIEIYKPILSVISIIISFADRWLTLSTVGS